MLNDPPTRSQNVLAVLQANQQARQDRLGPILEDLRRAGWSENRVLIIEPLIQRMYDSLTADDLRTLAALPSWPTSK